MNMLLVKLLYGSSSNFLDAYSLINEGFRFLF